MRLQDAFICISLGEGASLIPRVVMELLLYSAFVMHKKKEGSITIESDHYQGFVSTKWHSLNLGTLTGICFDAELASADGKMYSVSYMVSPRFLEAGMPEPAHWGMLPPGFREHLLSGDSGASESSGTMH